jgi:hypothetical protein
MKSDKIIPVDRGCEHSSKCIKCPRPKCKFDILTEIKSKTKKKKKIDKS